MSVCEIERQTRQLEIITALLSETVSQHLGQDEELREMGDKGPEIFPPIARQIVFLAWDLHRRAEELEAKVLSMIEAR